MDHYQNLKFLELTFRRGWTQANLTGANLKWPYELFEAKNRPLTQPEIWKFGAVNSVTYFSCSFM
jgi:hypothetical protein